MVSLCRGRDLNPHGILLPRDFKSLVSTSSTTPASNKPMLPYFWLKINSPDIFISCLFEGSCYHEPMDLNEQNKRLVTSEETSEEVSFESDLRPQQLSDYIGQESIKKNLEVFMTAATQRGEPIEHVLLHGAPGLGKTTRAHIIGNEMGVNLRDTSGPTIEKAGDLAAILTNLQPGDILFIDEIHRLKKIIEESLYPAMEDYALDIIIGQGPSARTLRLELPKFTLIGATTKVSQLSNPLRDRFGSHFKLDFYTDPDIETILNNNAKKLGVALDSAAAQCISSRCRKTPRIANRLLKRIRDLAQVKGNGMITPDIAKQALDMLEVDELGLDKTDRLLLDTIVNKFSGGPVGLNTLAAATGEDMDTIEDVYEPYLMQLGFINRTQKGRTATQKAYEHLGLKTISKNSQDPLI